MGRRTSLQGRGSELVRLVKAYRRVAEEDYDDTASSELVLVHGVSGTGKSTLVLKLRDHLQTTQAHLRKEDDDDSFFFAMGKFDQLQSTVPYQALVQAINALFGQIHRNKTYLKHIRERIHASLGPEVQSLVPLIPNLARVIGIQRQESYPNLPVVPDQAAGTPATTTAAAFKANEDAKGVSQALTRLKVICRTLIRAVCDPLHPCVLFLDDVQWADEGSLEVIKSLLSDRLSKHLLLICAYRDDEMNPRILERYFLTNKEEDDAMSHDGGGGGGSVSSVSSMEDDFFRMPVTEISLTSLDLESVNSLVSDFLEVSPSETWELSQVVLTKTQGNPYFVLQYVDLLQSKKLVRRIVSEEGDNDDDDEEEDAESQDGGDCTPFEEKEEEEEKKSSEDEEITNSNVVQPEQKETKPTNEEDQEQKEEEEKQQDGNDAEPQPEEPAGQDKAESTKPEAAETTTTTTTTTETTTTATTTAKTTTTKPAKKKKRGFRSFKLEYDLNTIQKVVSDSVVEVLTAKVQTLPVLVQQVLQIASFLGNRFNVDTLVIVSHHELTVSKKAPRVQSALHRERVVNALARGLKEGLVLKVDKNSYEFSHDRVQQTLQAMIENQHDREHLHLRFGMVLWDRINRAKEFDADLMIMAVDNLNRGSAHIPTRRQRFQLAALNLDCAHWAIGKTALFSAVEYVRAGLALLDETAWDEQYSLSMELYGLAAQLEHATGNFVRCKIMIAAIHRNAKTINDRLPAWLTEVDSLASHGDLVGAIHTACDVLKQIGCVIPPKPSKLHLIVEIAAAERATRKWEDDDFLNLPLATDPTVLAQLKLLSTLAICAFSRGERSKHLVLVSTIRAFRISCRYGLTPASLSSFACFGAVKSVLGDRNFGCRFGGIGLTLVNALQMPEVKCRTVYMAYCFSFMFKIPLSQGRDLFLDIYHTGLANGDIDHAYYSAHCHLVLLYMSGAHLSEVEARCRKMCLEMEEFQLTFALGIASSTWQFALNYLGQSVNPSILNGEAVDGSTIEEMQRNHNMAGLTACGRYQLWLAYVFQDWEVMAVKLEELETIMHCLQGHFTSVFSEMSVGMASFALYRLTGKRKHRVHAKKKIDFFRQLKQKGCVHAQGCMKLLVAEQAASSNNRTMSLNKVEELYLDAIDTLRLESFKEYTACAFERLSQVLMAHGDMKNARLYMMKSMAIYEAWGAKARSAWMKEKYSFLDMCR